MILAGITAAIYQSTSCFYNATQKAEGCMEFPPINWASEGDEEEDNGIFAQICASNSNPFLGSTDTIQPTSAPALLVEQVSCALYRHDC
jgi:hypothetical protein